MRYAIRSATAADEPFLWQMLYYAAHMDESGEPLDSARTNPALALYVRGWDRAGDLGVIADYHRDNDTACATPIGAVWLRSMLRGWPLLRHVDPATPELAIAVAPDHLGRGVGSLTLTRILTDTTTLYSAVALSVRANNPARRPYVWQAVRTRILGQA
jgi:GNAT superfamily N-acetyltransferase